MIGKTPNPSPGLWRITREKPTAKTSPGYSLKHVSSVQFSIPTVHMCFCSYKLRGTWHPNYGQATPVGSHKPQPLKDFFPLSCMFQHLLLQSETQGVFFPTLPKAIWASDWTPRNDCDKWFINGAQQACTFTATSCHSYNVGDIFSHVPPSSKGLQTWMKAWKGSIPAGANSSSTADGHTLGY